MHKYSYGIYQSLLVINVLSIFFTRQISFLPDFSAIIGAIIILAAVILDLHWEMFWQKQESQLITDGIYSHIRHPFLAFILIASFGISIAFNHLISLTISILTTVIIVLGAKKEEKLLVKKLGNRYKRYMEKVPYRFIPKVI